MAGEWAFPLYGNARITAIHLDGKSFGTDVTDGDLWYFSTGIPHSVQGLNPDGAQFLLVSDDGIFSEYETVLLTDWMAHTPHDVLSANFGVSPAGNGQDAAPGKVYFSGHCAGCARRGPEMCSWLSQPIVNRNLVSPSKWHAATTLGDIEVVENWGSGRLRRNSCRARPHHPAVQKSKTWRRLEELRVPRFSGHYSMQLWRRTVPVPLSGRDCSRRGSSWWFDICLPPLLPAFIRWPARDGTQPSSQSNANPKGCTGIRTTVFAWNLRRRKAAPGRRGYSKCLLRKAKNLGTAYH
jgi:hypothetical protein